MPRKRRPLNIEGQSVVPDAPGLEFRRGGSQAYWRACADARRRKYEPELVRLHGDLTTLEGLRGIERAAHEMQNQMLEWLGDPAVREQIVYDGTLRALARCYQRDPRSPFHGLRQNTRITYASSCKTLETMFGGKIVVRMTGQDVREMFNEVMAPTKSGARPRVRHAKAVVRQMLPILLNYGAEARLPGCLALAEVMDRMTLRVPAETRKTYKSMLPKKIPMAYTHARDIVGEALRRYAETGLRRWLSVALGTAAQFEFTLRQIDVIGEFETIRPGQVVPVGVIVRHGKTWRPGLCFENFATGMLDVETSKNDTHAPFDPAEYPLFVKAFEAVPVDQRRGPLVIDEDGLPMFKRFYADLYREVADAVNVPKEVWNMRARHGGLTEGYEAIVESNPVASLTDLRFHGQHSDLDTTLKNYIVGGVAATRRVIRKRVAHREKKQIA